MLICCRLFPPPPSPKKEEPATQANLQYSRMTTTTNLRDKGMYLYVGKVRPAMKDKTDDGKKFYSYPSCIQTSHLDSIPFLKVDWTLRALSSKSWSHILFKCFGFFSKIFLSKFFSNSKFFFVKIFLSFFVQIFCRHFLVKIFCQIFLQKFFVQIFCFFRKFFCPNFFPIEKFLVKIFSKIFLSKFFQKFFCQIFFQKAFVEIFFKIFFQNFWLKIFLSFFVQIFG